MSKVTYRYFGSLGQDMIDTAAGDLMALRLARLISDRADLQVIEKCNDGRWVPLHVTQMLYGPDRDANLRGAYGSASKRAFAKAQREFERAAA